MNLTLRISVAVTCHAVLGRLHSKRGVWDHRNYQAEFDLFQSAFLSGLQHGVFTPFVWYQQNSTEEYPLRVTYPSNYYANNINSTRRLWANKYVRRVQFKFTQFSLEHGYDFFVYGPNQTTGTLSVPFWFGDTSDVDYQGAGRALSFTSDYSLGLSGFTIAAAQVCCGTGSTYPTSNVPFGQRVQGLLLGMHDTVYLRSDGVPPGLTLRVALWGFPADGWDVGIWAKCNGIPTPSDYTAYSNGSTTSEFLELPFCLGTYYFAVNSILGEGTFNLVISRANGNGKPAYRAGIAYSGANVDAIAEGLRDTTRYVYGLSEGQVFISHWDLYVNAGPNCSRGCGGLPCDVCLTDLYSESNGVCENGRIFVFNRLCDGRYAAHEIAHCKWGLGDEYKIGSQGEYVTYCGHSFMSGANPNMSRHQYNLCTSLNHHTYYDEDPNGAPYPDWPDDAGLQKTPCWSSLNGHPMFSDPITALITPDNYLYAGFPFVANATPQLTVTYHY